MSSPVRTVSLGIICHNRPAEVLDAIASTAGHPFHERIVVDMASDPPLEPMEGVRLLRSDENTGVAGGRNLLMEAATGDAIVFLDDDAVLCTPVVEPVRDRFAAQPEVVAIAFAVQRPGGRRESAEQPFRGDPAHDRPRECAYFVGCGHAVRRDAMAAVGGYDDRFFYDGEETDLSFALLGAGGRIWFDPTILVEHRRSPRGRVTSGAVAGLTLRNRYLICRRHLPLPIAAVHLLAWTLRTGVMAARARDLRPWAEAWRDGVTAPVRRQPLDYRTLRGVHRLGGRVLW